MEQSNDETQEMFPVHPLIDALLSLELPSEDYAVFGSGPMYAHGLKDLGHDLDIVARGAAWEKAAEKGEIKITESGDDKVIELFDGFIEIFRSWAPGEWDIDALIDEAEEISGIRFVQLEKVLAWKKIKNRPKDAEHIALIEAYLRLKA
jgi:hypothetical protein